MQSTQSGKLLLPIDGSKRSLETVRQLAALKPFQRHKVVLLHVFNVVPECYWDLAKEPKSIKIVTPVKAWEAEQRKGIEATLQKARGILLRAGFDKEAVKIVIRDRKKGIARDVVAEARNNYTAVIIRRRGSGAIRSLVLGSVATKLIESITFAPVLIMGRRKQAGKILVAMDSSQGAMRALDFVAAQLGGFDYDVHLLHVIRGDGEIARKHPELTTTDDCRDKAQEMIRATFDEARRHLVAGGFSDNQISETVITKAYSRAGTIAKIVKEQKYDTIVIGRRGVSQPRSFAIGRVSNKLIQMARQFSEWEVD